MARYKTLSDFLTAISDVNHEHDEAVKIEDLDIAIVPNKITGVWMLLESESNSVSKNNNNEIDISAIPTFVRSYKITRVLYKKLITIYLDNDSDERDRRLEHVTSLPRHDNSKRSYNRNKQSCEESTEHINNQTSPEAPPCTNLLCMSRIPSQPDCKSNGYINNSELIAQRLPATINETTPTASIAISKLSLNIKGEIIIFRKYYNIEPTHIAGTYTSNSLLVIVTDGITFSFDSYRLDDIDNLDKELGSVFNTIFNRTDEYKLQYKTFFDKGGINGILYVKIKNITYEFHVMGMYTIDKKDNTIIVDANTLRDFIQDLSDEVLLSI